MLIAQITDLHIGTGDDVGAEMNYDRLMMVFSRLATLKRQPDAIVATGDLTETGSEQAYRLLKRVYEIVGYEDILPCLGNHDRADAFARVFGREYINAGYCQYTVDLGPVCLVVADTHDEREHGGVFCAQRAAALDAMLAEVSDKPVLLALHHPPLVPGLGWMGAKSMDEPWVERLRAVVSRHPHVRKIIAGHLHRVIDRPFAGSSCIAAAATAPQVHLELAPITSGEADGRPLVIDEPPGFALHLWDGTQFITHHGVAGDFNVILRYHDRFRDVMRDVFQVPER